MMYEITSHFELQTPNSIIAIFTNDMSFDNLTNILEIALLAGVMIILIRFIFLNYSGRIQKPQAWVHAVKHKEVSAQLLKLERTYSDRIRFYNIWLQIEHLKKNNVNGAFAEVGVYKGKTARIMHLCDPERELHLFDTFDGFPGQDLVNEKGKAATYTQHHFSDTSKEKVIAYLGERPNIHFHEGYFPDTAEPLKEEKFAFVNLDADLHKPTLTGLEFFYPRLSPGGIIMVHDYNSDWPELMRAVDQFCDRIPEQKVLLPDADSTVMLIRNG